jgi:hypothetical protein
MVNGLKIYNLISTDKNLLYKELEWMVIKIKVLELLISKKKYNLVGNLHTFQNMIFVKKEIKVA